VTLPKRLSVLLEETHVYRAFSSFLLGNLLLEAAPRGAETSPVEEPLEEG
jgi:hypothetical protein